MHTKYVLAIVLMFILALSAIMYNKHEDRKAYYKCLEVAETISKHSKDKITNLPWCRL